MGAMGQTRERGSRFPLKSLLTVIVSEDDIASHST